MLMADITKNSARNRILDSAATLFYTRGINATGIDLIIAEAGVAKASLYNNFESKEALVAAYLEKLKCDFEELLTSEVEMRGLSLDIPFDLLERSLIQGGFYGCPFTNALTELPESSLVRKQVQAYRDVVRDYFLEITKGDELVTDQLMLVYDGAFTSCKLDPNSKKVLGARNLARKLASLS